MFESKIIVKYQVVAAIEIMMYCRIRIFNDCVIEIIYETLNVITLGETKTDNIDRVITITYYFNQLYSINQTFEMDINNNH